MIKQSFSVLLAGVFMFINEGNASSLTEVITSGSLPHNTTHTLLHAPELKPISFDNSYQTAAICFLGAAGCGNETGFGRSDDNFDVDTVKQCREEGYTVTSCTRPAYLYRQCPYNSIYYAECRKDTARACGDIGYGETTCPAGSVEESVCTYDSRYKKCKCNPCEGFNYTHEQTTSQGYEVLESCNSCGTLKYKRRENSCPGYQVCECGGEIGASVCYTGSAKKYSKCKSCCSNECSLSDCPSGNTCRYEACSNKYCVTGCAVNYTNWCTQPNLDCSDMGYTSTVPCKEGVKCPYGNYWHCFSD